MPSGAADESRSQSAGRGIPSLKVRTAIAVLAGPLRSARLLEARALLEAAVRLAPTDERALHILG